MLNMIRSGLGFVKAGKAIRDIRTSTDQEKKDRARHYLMEILGKGRGLPTKLGQFLAMDGGQEFRETLDDSIRPMPFGEVVGILESSYQVHYKKIFRSLEEKGLPASLGQVHFGTLKDGSEVAVKVQFPDVRGSVEAELILFGLMPKVGPVKNWSRRLATSLFPKSSHNIAVQILLCNHGKRVFL